MVTCSIHVGRLKCAYSSEVERSIAVNMVFLLSFCDTTQGSTVLLSSLAVGGGYLCT
jgi:hypothetical protein